MMGDPQEKHVFVIAIVTVTAYHLKTMKYFIRPNLDWYKQNQCEWKKCDFARIPALLTDSKNLKYQVVNKMLTLRHYYKKESKDLDLTTQTNEKTITCLFVGGRAQESI